MLRSMVNDKMISHQRDNPCVTVCVCERERGKKEQKVSLLMRSQSHYTFVMFHRITAGCFCQAERYGNFYIYIYVYVLVIAKSLIHQKYDSKDLGV